MTLQIVCRIIRSVNGTIQSVWRGGEEVTRLCVPAPSFQICTNLESDVRDPAFAKFGAMVKR